MDISETIYDLILSQREGSYWDFKERPHEENADLLHDILCMANSISESDKYIIFGVTDPGAGCEIVGVSGQRKNQADYIDFVRSKSFAGDNRPEIELHTFNFRNGTVDVLVIFERPNKPYYLSSDYRSVKANHIYTRNGDTNTPKNLSADYYVVEKLWRQRFHLDMNPKEKFEVILEDRDNWVLDLGNKETAYYAPSPEYQIIFSETDDGWEIYSFFFMNEKSFFGKAQFRFHTTILFELGYCYVDEMRIAIPVPRSSCFDVGKMYYYSYFEKDTIEYKFLELIGLRSLLASRMPISIPFIFFKNSEERKLFDQHLEGLADLESKIKSDSTGDMVTKRMLGRGHDVGDSARFLSVARKEYAAWSGESGAE